MIRNYIKSAFRTLLKNKFYSLINIIGLTVGLATGLLILIWVQDEFSYDKFEHNGANLYKVNANMGTEVSKQVYNAVPGPIAVWAKREIPEVLDATRIRGNYTYTVFRYKDRRFTEQNSVFVDPSFFKLFDISFINGNRNNPFPALNSVLLTETTARKYFGTTDATGRYISANGQTDFLVAGIVHDSPKNSSIRFTMLFPMALAAKDFKGNGLWKTIDQDWGNYNFETYLLLKPGTTPVVLGQKLAAIQRRNHSGDGNAYLIQPFTQLHLYNADGSAPGLRIVQTFILIALLILLIASINYVNLSTARSMLRSKEVSIRKIIGAEKSQIFFQFIIETTLIYLIALILAFGLILLSMPAYNSLTNKTLSLNLASLDVWLIIGCSLFLTLLAVSIYPAILLSSFKPLEALKGKVSASLGNVSFRRVLVIIQFTFSIALIISTIIIGKQLDFINHSELGYNREHVFAIELPENMQPHYAAIRAELLGQASIKAVSASDQNIIRISNSSGDADWEGKDPKMSFIIVQAAIDASFIPDFGLAMISGSRNFNTNGSDSSSFILNQTAVKEIGMKNPIGKHLKYHNQNGTIIGVLKDFHFASMREKIKPAIFFYRNSWFSTVFIKTTTEQSPAAILATSRVWKKYNSEYPFEYHFLDESFDELYKSETRIAELFSFFAAIAVLICCLGLFGLAAFTAQVKTREIGIRKVLGASMFSVVYIMVADFLLLVLVALLIAIPIAWLAMNSWLKAYAYHVTIGWSIFVFSGFVAILIALITVSFHAFKAAMANPVKSFRTD